MSRRKPRGLTKEEEALWSEVARRTERIERKPTSLTQNETASEKPKNPKPKIQRPIKPFKVGSAKKPSIKNDVLPTLSDRLAAAPIQMDHKDFGRMRRGKLTPEGRIDLHGMTLSEAHPALLSFVMSAHAAGKRLVLVITGKGKDRDDLGPIPVRRGVLRHQVPQWLAQAPLSSLVLQVSEAHGKHGGGGAYYVYLRRKR